VITVSRGMLVVLAALFSAYHVVLGVTSMAMYRHPAPVIVAIVLYALATCLSLLHPSRIALPAWVAAFDLAACVALPVLVDSQLDLARENGYATWYVAAIGTLMTIVVVRRRTAFAWVGTAFLVGQTVVAAGVTALGAFGVVGSIVWVVAAVVVTRALGRMTRDASRFSRAERQVVEWHAEQEAHVIERQRRLDETYQLAAPMLIRIADSGGLLSDEERAECLLLEASMRDEIRGRALLDDAVREQVLAARRRGTAVVLLDDGGLDDLDERDLRRVHGRLAMAIQESSADRLVVRTVESGSAVAVTVVGLVSRGADAAAADAPPSASAESEGADDEVELWLEIPRHVEPAPADV
jgi:hypothetical protein